MILKLERKLFWLVWYINQSFQYRLIEVGNCHGSCTTWFLIKSCVCVDLFWLVWHNNQSFQYRFIKVCNCHSSCTTWFLIIRYTQMEVYIYHLPLSQNRFSEVGRQEFFIIPLVDYPNLRALHRIH